MKILVSLPFFLGMVLAQDFPLCTNIITARSPVLIYSPEVRSLSLAECLRKAAVDYRRQIELITVPYFNQDGSSYVNSLALAGINVYEANINSREGFILIDSIGYALPEFDATNPGEIDFLEDIDVASYKSWFQKTLSVSKKLTLAHLLVRLRRN